MNDGISEEDKEKQIDEAFSTFFSQFGNNDVYLQVFLEVLMEELYGGRLSKNKSLWFKIE